MQRAQPARHTRWALVRALLLGVAFVLAAALLLWLKTVETDGVSLSLPSELQDFATFMPVCECGNVPVARGLVIRGLSVAESTTFLLAAPIINPVTLLATSQAFRLDPSIVWIRLAGALLIANLVGGLIALYKDQMELVSKGFYNTLCEVGATDEHHHEHHDHDHSSNRRWDRWQEGIVIFRDEVSLMLKVLCLGALIAGA